MVATATIGSAAIGAGASIFGASKAAKAQKKAAQQANQLQMAMFNRMQENQAPYMGIGKQASDLMSNKLLDFTKPVIMDQAALEATPGYQFNLKQGLKSVQNSAAARGLGNSGAALKGAAQYATGLADSTYQNQFNNAVTNQTNAYNRLMGVIGMGQNAAAGVGNAGIQTGTNIGQNQIGVGNAKAGAIMAGANALGNFANTVGGYAMTNAMMNGMYGNNNNNSNWYNSSNNTAWLY